MSNLPLLSYHEPALDVNNKKQQYTKMLIYFLPFLFSLLYLRYFSLSHSSIILSLIFLLPLPLSHSPVPCSTLFFLFSRLIFCSLLSSTITKWYATEKRVNITPCVTLFQIDRDRRGIVSFPLSLSSFLFFLF